MNDSILSLRVVRFNDEPVAEPIVVEFGPTGGTIGRATDCTLVLPDQQRAISRVHARVEFRNGDYLLCDLGSNPSVLNQRALGGTREARLANGDRLMIGTYLLEVTIGERPAGARSATGLADPLAAVSVLGGPLPAGGQGDPFGFGALDPLGQPTLDPLGQPGFGGRAPIASGPRYAGSESDHVAPEFQSFAAPSATPRAPQAPVIPHAPASSSSGIPADYDPLADALAQWESSPQQGGGLSGGGTQAAPLFAPPPAAPSQPAAFTPNFAPAHLPADPPRAQAPAAPGGPTGLPASLLGDPAGSGGATPFDDLLAPASAPAPAGEPLIPVVPDDLTEIAPDSALPPGARSAAAARGAVPAAAAAAPAPSPAATPAAFAATPAQGSQAGGMSESPSTATSASTSAVPPTSPFAATPASLSASMPASPSASAPASLSTATPMSPSDDYPSTALNPAVHGTPRTAAATGDAFAALLEGLGLDPARTPNLPPAEMSRMIGMMLREALRGTMAVLRARSMTRREARLDVTLIVARDNNPLKFFPDVDSALQQMLTGRGTGYLPPAEALERAFNDIESHELAVIVGMRAALTEVLGRFDPASIEAQLKEGGVIDKVLSNRKAKLWDLFVERQAGVAREAEDDFQRLFGKAFNDAYEAQIDALHKARKNGKTDPTGQH